MSRQAKIRSKMMGILSSEGYANFKRGKARYLRILRVDKPRVMYFHQVDDPYSYLAVQKLKGLQDNYNLPFVSYLVGPTEDVFKGDAAKFNTWARTDADHIASYFGIATNFSRVPTSDEVAVANQRLIDESEQLGFADAAMAVGEALWHGDIDLKGDVSARTLSLLDRNNKVRKRLGHYLGGTFYFEGEWYWGVDRLHLLETRLQQEGYGSGNLVCPLPAQDDFIPGDFTARSDTTLEYYPSLRSPYTAIGHRRVLDLVKKTGVTLKLRPVMPMMMRGVPAPRAKQQYIMADSGREARYYGEKFGPFCDPFGEPVKRAFAAFHYAQEVNCGLDFVTEYLGAAFAEGLDITQQAGLAEVCRRAGFQLDQVDPNADWMSTLEENLAVMASESLWGVPSFRVTGGDETAFACWGQDRIWRVAAEIIKRGEQF